MDHIQQIRHQFENDDIPEKPNKLRLTPNIIWIQSFSFLINIINIFIYTSVLCDQNSHQWRCSIMVTWYRQRHVTILYKFDTVLYQFLETETSKRILMGLLKCLGFSLYPLSFFLYSPFKCCLSIPAFFGSHCIFPDAKIALKFR